MSKNPQHVLRHRITGVIFGMNPVMEGMPEMEKILFSDAFPEKCMPEHIKERVEAAPSKKSKKKAAPKLDLSTEDIPDDPDEILAENMDSADAAAINEDASRGLDD
jgi:hypothetical protein